MVSRNDAGEQALRDRKTFVRSHTGIVLLSKALVPLFVNAEARGVFSWFCKANEDRTPLIEDQNWPGLPPFIEEFSQDLLLSHRSHLALQPFQPTVFSKVIEGHGCYLQLRGGTCSLAIETDDTYFLITLNLIEKAELI